MTTNMETISMSLPQIIELSLHSSEIGTNGVLNVLLHILLKHVKIDSDIQVEFSGLSKKKFELFKKPNVIPKISIKDINHHVSEDSKKIVYKVESKDENTEGSIPQSVEELQKEIVKMKKELKELKNFNRNFNFMQNSLNVNSSLNGVLYSCNLINRMMKVEETVEKLAALLEELIRAQSHSYLTAKSAMKVVHLIPNLMKRIEVLEMNLNITNSDSDEKDISKMPFKTAVVNIKKQLETLSHSIEDMKGSSVLRQTNEKNIPLLTQMGKMGAELNDVNKKLEVGSTILMKSDCEEVKKKINNNVLDNISGGYQLMNVNTKALVFDEIQRSFDDIHTKMAELYGFLKNSKINFQSLDDEIYDLVMMINLLKTSKVDRNEIHDELKLKANQCHIEEMERKWLQCSHEFNNKLLEKFDQSEFISFQQTVNDKFNILIDKYNKLQNHNRCDQPSTIEMPRPSIEALFSTIDSNEQNKKCDVMKAHMTISKILPTFHANDIPENQEKTLEPFKITIDDKCKISKTSSNKTEESHEKLKKKCVTLCNKNSQRQLTLSKGVDSTILLRSHAFHEKKNMRKLLGKNNKIIVDMIPQLQQKKRQKVLYQQNNQKTK